MSLSDTLHYYWVEMADPRCYNWFLVKSCIPILSILASYLYFIYGCGPRYMEHRQPYSLKTFIKYYNIFQIVANACIVYGMIANGWFTEISVYCEPVNYSPTGKPLQLAAVTWWMYMLKVVDLIETPIFVLRKKNRQISFLHVYHHVSTALIAWLMVRYIAGGMSTFLCVVNCTVHVIMYTYYLLAAEAKSLKGFLEKVKPYITTVQMVQFVVLIVYGIQALLPSCPVPKFAAVTLLTDLFINFYLFYDFYQKNYSKKKAM